MRSWMRSDNLAILGGSGCGKSWGEYIEENMNYELLQKIQKQKKLEEYIDQLNTDTKQKLDDFFNKYNNKYDTTTLEEFKNLISNKINDPNVINDDVDEYAKILYYFLTLKFGDRENFDKINNILFFDINNKFSNETLLKYILSTPKPKPHSQQLPPSTAAGGKYRRKSRAQKKTKKAGKKVAKKTARRRRK